MSTPALIPDIASATAAPHTRQHAPEIQAFVAAVNDVLTRLKQGNVPSRVVLDVAGSAHRRL